MNVNDAKIYELSDLVTMAAGYAFRGKIVEAPGADIQVVQMRDVSLEEGVQWEECLRVEALVKKESDWLLQDDILFAARGNLPYAFHISSLPDHLHMLASPHFFVIRLQSPEVLPAFLAWFLNQQPTQRYFAACIEGSTTKSIRREVLEEAPVSVPPLAFQSKIVGLHSVLRRERQCLTQLIQNGEMLQRGLAEQLASGNVTF